MIFASKQCSTPAELCRQTARWWLFEATVRKGKEREQLIGYAAQTWRDAATLDRGRVGVS